MQARAAVESKFDFETVAAGYLEIFKELVSRRWARWEPWLQRAGVFALIVAGIFLGIRLAAYDWTAQFVVSYLSPDGVLTAMGRERLASLLMGSALFATLVAFLLLSLSRERSRRALCAAVEWDALHERGLRVPNPCAILASSTGLALLIIALWTLRSRLGEPVLFLFAKEGLLEQATFVLAFAGAMLCAGAAIRWSPRSSLIIRCLYALCAFGLFIVAMEEINWGQTFLGFQTPASWAAINYQQETSLHNLMNRDELNWMSQLVATTFGITVVAMVLWTARAPRSIIVAIAPHASLVPLALLVVYAGARLHQEILELLLSLFFVFYSWRIYVAARGSAHSQPWTLVSQQADVPLANDKMAMTAPKRRDTSRTSC